jgi:DNA polymerase-3 subunit gamma/tau
MQAPQPAVHLDTFADVISHAGALRDLKLKHALETTVRLIRFERGRLEAALTDDAPSGLAGELSRRLEEWTGERWMIAVSGDGGAPTVAEVRRSAQARLVSDARADPVVAAALQRFPGAEIVDVRVRGDGRAPMVEDASVPPPDELIEGD